jgi:hypothetical protein
VCEDILKIIMECLNYKLRNNLFIRQIELYNEQNAIFEELFTRRPQLRIDHVIIKYNNGACMALFVSTINLTAGRL